MKRILALAAVALAAAAGGTAVASTSDRAALPIHLVNVAGFPHWYIQDVKADVTQAYWNNTQPIEFGATGSKIYLETPAQRAADGTFFDGTVYCFHSDVPPDPDAAVTSTATVGGDAAGVTLAIAKVQDGRCGPSP